MEAEQGKSRIGYDTLKLTASKVITMVIAMVSGMLLSRFRSLTEYGTYSQLLMAINLVCSLIMLGLPNSINFFLAKAQTQEERDKFLSVYYTLNTILSLIVGLVLVISTPLLEKVFKNQTIKCFWYFLAFFPWTKIIMSSIENLLIVCEKTNVLMVYRVINSVALIGIILFVQFVGGTFSTYMMLYLATEVIFTLWTYWQMLECTSNFKIGFNKSMIKTIFTYSIPIGVASMIGTINVELDKLVITSFFSTEKLAIYTNASKELPVTIVATSITAVLLPQMVRLLHKNKKAEAVKLWNSATTISFAIICLVAIGCFVFAPDVITILYSEKYLEGVAVFRVYCLTLLLRCTYFGMMLNATGITKAVLKSSIGALLLNTVLNYICYFVFGFIGPAMATFLATFSMALYQLCYSCKKIGIKFIDIFPWKNCFTLLMLNIVLGAGFYFTKNYMVSRLNISSVLVAVLLGSCWMVVFFAITFKNLKSQWIVLNEKR